MESAKEKKFYEALGVVPELPAGVIGGVERSVRSYGIKRRIALAACLLLAFIIPAVLLTQQNTSGAFADNSDSMDELLYAFEFMSGGLDTDFLFMVDAESSGNYVVGGSDNAGDDSLASVSQEQRISHKLAHKETDNEH